MNAERHQAALGEVDVALIGQLQRRDHGQREETEHHEWIGERRAESLRGVQQPAEIPQQLFGRKIAHQPGDRQRQMEQNFVPVGRDQPALFPYGGERRQHRLVVHADDAEIVRVVRHGRAQSAAPQPQTGDESAADPSLRGVPVHDRHLREIARRTRREFTVHGRAVDDPFAGDDFAGNGFDDAEPAPRRDPQIVRRQRAAVAADAGEIRAAGRSSAGELRGPAVFPDPKDVEILEIVQQRHVGAITGRNGPEVVNVIELRRVQRHHAQGADGGDAVFHGQAQDPVQMPFVVEHGGGQVVADQHAAAGPPFVFGDQRGQSRQIVFRRPLAQHHPAAATEFVERFFVRTAFVVGVAARQQISVELFSPQAGRVPVAGLAARGEDLFPRVPVAADDAGVVHHLAQSAACPFGKHPRDRVGFEDLARRFERRGGDARGRVQIDVHGKPLARFAHEAEPLEGRGVGDLVRIGEHGRRAVRQHQFGEAARRQHRAFDMAVRFDEAGHEKFSRGVKFLPSAVSCADADDQAVADGDVRLFDLAGEEIGHLRVFDDTIGGARAAGL